MRTDALQEAELFTFGSFETGKSAASYAFVPGGGQRPGGQDEHGKKSRGGGRNQVASSYDAHDGGGYDFGAFAGLHKFWQYIKKE